MGHDPNIKCDRHSGESRNPEAQAFGEATALQWRRSQADPGFVPRRIEPDMKLPCVYILASKRNGTLYVGVTSDLVQRIWQHKNDLVEGFTKRYGVHTLVWCEVHESMESSIAHEKAIKEWKRVWKLELIEKRNPTWRDLYPEFV